MKISEIKELIQLVNETDIGELEIEGEDGRLLLRKGRVQIQGDHNQFTPSSAPQVHSMPSTTITEPAPVSTSIAGEEKQGKPLTSPMVGTFYRASRPGVEPFIKMGDLVQAGQILCIIEAMKLMNEIEAEFAGKVVDILVEDGQPVEYGQTLFLIDPEI